MRVLVTGGSGFIGTNLIDVLLERDVEILNLDINAPKKDAHSLCWQQCDILDFDRTLSCFRTFSPTHIVHLAARTDTLSEDLDDYQVNTLGTINILNCIKSLPDARRLIITSSQFVYGPPGEPKNDEDYKPIGAYGLSKVLSEKATRSAELSCTWTIIRPTNIWGPWHPRYPKEFWLVLKKGFYFHPGGKSAIRSYGYVKNIVYQILAILEAPPLFVDQKVYYVGDLPIALDDWVNGFSLAITGSPARVVPRGLLKFAAAAGTVLRYIGVHFPITLSRYRSMTEDYLSPVETTIRQFGVPPYSLADGIKETADWLKAYWANHAS